MFRFLRFLAVFVALFVSANALAVGFVCESERTYTSCVSGYYLSDCGSYSDGRTLTESDLSAGNSCVLCPDGYDCEGGMKCPYDPNADEDDGFVCDEAYFSCESGYYLSDCGDTEYAWDGRTLTKDEVTFGNSCEACPEGYDCEGGMTCPAGSNKPITSCPADQFLSDCNNLSSWTGQTLDSSNLSANNSCVSCPDEYSCSGGLSCPARITGESGFTCDYKIFTGCGEGRFLSDCGASSNWIGQTLERDELEAGNSCLACPDGYDCEGGATCPINMNLEYLFEVITTSGTTSFKFNINASGNYWVDWGDGKVEMKKSVESTTFDHTYASAGAYTIKIGGVSGSYPYAEDDTPAMTFYNKTNVAALDGSLGKLFPVLKDSGVNPYFGYMFSGATNLKQIPSTLFLGIGEAQRAAMFEGMFANSGLTSIPVGLFNSITQPADGLFSDMFLGIKALTSLPEGLFAHIDAAAGEAEYMFSYTFSGTGLTSLPDSLFGELEASDGLFSNTFSNTPLEQIPADLFSGVTGVAPAMYQATFDTADVRSIPVGLFDGLYGQDSIPDTMFEGTFSACTSLSGPAARFSDNLGGKFLHEVWPMLEADMGTYADTNIDNLKYIPTSWGGGGLVKCAAGTYLPENAYVCETCPAGSYCPGVDELFIDSVEQGRVSCPAGYTSNATGNTSGVDCFGGYKFTIETLPMTGAFELSLVSVKGNYWIDWGDDTPVEYIPVTDFAPKTVLHTYEGSAEARTIKIGGLTTEYNQDMAAWSSGVFKINGNQYVSKVSGSLGAIFPTMSDGTQPGFFNLFMSCPNLTEIPSTLFDGVHGQPRVQMFFNSFAGTGLTSIPEGLFAGLDGAPTEMLFANTFAGTKITSIPDGLFDGLDTSAPGAENMFAQTFYNCTSLTGPAAKMSAANGGQYLHKIWPMTGATMQTYTGTNIDGLRAIPVSWGGEGVLDCVAGTYQSADETECLTCALGAFCVGGLAPQETCADGTYADETGLAECKACDKLYGVGASSSLPRTSINNCYIPKDVGLSDGKGNFSFIENCQYQ